MILITLVLAFASISSAHTVAWIKGMYCLGGNNTSVDDNNTDLAVNPLYNLTKTDWWFQHDRGCDLAPPAPGDILSIPAGGSFTVELAHNRAQTTLSYNGQFTSEWPDGKDHPEDWNAVTDPGPQAGCLSDGAMHASNQSTTGGTAWAISYQSELSAVTIENLVVFTTLEHTPWKRIATYEVPARLPACPPEGCTCAWLWVPHLCGQSNIYMAGYKCNVTGATSTTPLAPAQPPVYCADDQTKCVTGAKQMIAWNQLDGNNIELGFPLSPAYSTDCGWTTGSQNDIFASSGSTTTPSGSNTTSSNPTTGVSGTSPVSEPTTLATMTSASSYAASSLPASTEDDACKP